ncbi:MAG: hypothetical protein RML72_07670 [Bacteroidia bacterium]|nr:hypothetical protein [Bacteroidia bacterium]
MPSNYDIGIKEAFLVAFPSFFQRVTGLQIHSLKEENLELQATLKRTLDYVAKVQIVLPEGGQKEYLLHIEFQTRNHPQMHLRMLEYYTLLYRKYGLEVLQFVVYLGNENLKMQTIITHENLEFRYSIIDLRKYPAVDFLNAPTLEESILAILGDYGTLDADQIVEKILKKILSTPNLSKFETDKYITHLQNFAYLRGVQSVVNYRLKVMSIDYDITKDLRYIQGREDGMLIGIEKGIEKGMEKGMWLEKHNIAIQALIEGLEESTIMRITGLSLQEIEQLKKSLH